ncbi:YlaI family protein [Solibacillus sp. CAU 1738]|uniref:YlaI family protein n=1 Tax=Solibacillus sp. CAU 1738 TaxID=3140363 RepID=UPI003261CF26
MRVKCVICDTIQQLEDDLPLAKKLRNRPIHTYMCEPCNTRIAENTEKRLSTGKFHFFRTSSKIDEEF